MDPLTLDEINAAVMVQVPAVATTMTTTMTSVVMTVRDPEGLLGIMPSAANVQAAVAAATPLLWGSQLIESRNPISQDVRPRTGYVVAWKARVA